MTFSRKVVAVVFAALVTVVAGVTTAATVNYAFSVPVEQQLNYSADTEIGVTALTVKTNSADVAVGRSSDDRLHVSVRGSYGGGEPEVSVGAEGSEVSVECPSGKFWWCGLSLFVQVPEGVNVAVVGTNSNVQVDGLRGDTTVATTFGSISVTDQAGGLTVTTTAGDVMVRTAAASSININTTKGSVDLDAATPPDSLNIRSAFGNNVIRLPPTVDYNVDARSAEGDVKTEVVDNPASPRRVIVASEQGDIFIEPR